MFGGTRLQRRRRARIARAIAVTLLGVILLTPRDLSGVAQFMEDFSLVGAAYAHESG